ncbi:hypothetical protein Y032_0178g646 [Ancylostoma ceylanicum]|uniref:Uncharacterized protein n=1 Tax=Ancylostoma ceylanicum TaxID=53326 RepID=A0A016STT7_9BILA|nr:hypothetical protein Y032_0178g646 [Ancylostoma ceylanicum]
MIGRIADKVGEPHAGSRSRKRYIRQYVIHSRRFQPKPKRRKVTQQPLNEMETEYSSDYLAVEPIGRQPRADQPSTSKNKMHRMLV